MKDKFTEKPELFDEEGDSMAFGYGLGHGFNRFNPRPNKHESSKRNKYYYYPGYIIGYILKVLCLIAVARYGIPA